MYSYPTLEDHFHTILGSSRTNHCNAHSSGDLNRCIANRSTSSVDQDGLAGFSLSSHNQGAISGEVWGA